ncbi:Hypothetical predicted protein [Octopus vulgaris]|uniref:Uncharacterized protein n=1 Tax=Octopus vulgaris TaxID=6645 RepID=A0AA36AZR1_OCTVU|nr:Hypothetical predicted protein [Octopus vulgaris]
MVSSFDILLLLVFSPLFLFLLFFFFTFSPSLFSLYFSVSFLSPSPLLLAPLTIHSLPLDFFPLPTITNLSPTLSHHPLHIHIHTHAHTQTLTHTHTLPVFICARYNTKGSYFKHCVCGRKEQPIALC